VNNKVNLQVELNGSKAALCFDKKHLGRKAFVNECVDRLIQELKVSILRNIDDKKSMVEKFVHLKNGVKADFSYGPKKSFKLNKKGKPTKIHPEVGAKIGKKPLNIYEVSNNA